MHRDEQAKQHRVREKIVDNRHHIFCHYIAEHEGSEQVEEKIFRIKYNKKKFFISLHCNLCEKLVTK